MIFLEGLLRGRDHGVGVAAAFGDGHFALVHIDLPLAGALDVENVGVGHAGGLRRVGLRFEVGEEILDWVGHLTLLGG